MAISYKDAGVDLQSYAEAMARLPALIGRTHTPRVLPLPGGFAGLFRLQGAGQAYRDPVLVSGTDGVGTKLKVALLAGKYDTVGIDLVAMCVNDCLCLGAEPLFFLDYLALDRDDPDRVAALVKGVSDGCLEAGAALIGGETAIMPDLYAPGEFDMAGFCVGVVEKEEILDGSRIQAGDVLIGVASSGLHSNGFSLARKAVFEAGGLDIASPVDELGGTVGDVLLTPTRIYAKLVRELTNKEPVRQGNDRAVNRALNQTRLHGIAHITGGGLVENVSRIVPDGLQVAIDRNAWTIPPVFNWLQRLGDIDTEEMFRVFNMGIGLVLIVPSSEVRAVRAAAARTGDVIHVIGGVTV